MKKIVIASLIAGMAIFSACTKKASPGKTVVAKTSYTVDIIPLLQAKCTPCHLPTKGGYKADFENYESAKKYGNDMLTRVHLNPGEKGFMPFKGSKLSEEDIAVFTKWVADGLLEK